MAALLVEVTERNFNGSQLEVSITVQHTSGTRLGTMISVANAPVTSANFVSGLKTQLIAFALARFGVTIAPSDILVFGAPQ